MERELLKQEAIVSAFRFLSKNAEFYSILEDRLTTHVTDETTFIIPFFSRVSLTQRNWSVIPLWEGNMNTLLLEDRTEIPFMKRLCEIALKTGGHYMNFTALYQSRFNAPDNKSDLPLLSDLTKLSVDCLRFKLNEEDISQYFRTTPMHNPNVGGWTYIWPSNERFIIVTDCDDVSYVAGDAKEILGILGVTYDYCVSRVRGVYEKWLKDWSAVNAELAFCDEFSKEQLKK